MDLLKFFSTCLIFMTCACFSYEIIYLFVPLFRKLRHSGAIKPTR